MYTACELMGAHLLTFASVFGHSQEGYQKIRRCANDDKGLFVKQYFCNLRARSRSRRLAEKFFGSRKVNPVWVFTKNYLGVRVDLKKSMGTSTGSGTRFTQNHELRVHPEKIFSA